MKRSVSRRSTRLMSLAKLTATCLKLVSGNQKDMLPQTVYVSFRDMGGVYVKFLQLLVLRSEAFKTLYEYNVYDVYDHVGTETIDIHSTLRQELGTQAVDIALESDSPFAAGSFGQVYAANYQGKRVIVKVLRPSVSKDLKFDLKVLGFFSRCLNLFSFGNALNFKRIYKEFARTTLTETNYVLEADYASTLYERYRGHPNIVIAYTYRELSTARIIIQEYIDGIPATDLARAVQGGLDAERYIYETLGSDLKQQLVALGSEMLSSIFINGTAYGDPHPGNIKLLPNNRVGLIDYGLQAPAPRSTLNFHRLIQQYYNLYSGHPDMRGYSQVLLDMYGGDIIQAVHSLDNYYEVGSHHLLDSIIDNAEKIMNSERDQIDHLARNNKMMIIFNSIINKNNRFCLEYDLDGPEIARAGMLFISLVTSLGVKNAVLRQTYARVLEMTKDVALKEDKSPLHPETALEILANWFDQIAYKNPQLYRQIKLQRLSYV